MVRKRLQRVAQVPEIVIIVSGDYLDTSSILATLLHASMDYLSVVDARAEEQYSGTTVD